eukprot:1721425-Heterocapsa_arctica.AAC.1
MRAAVAELRCEPARQWLWARMRITGMKTPKWCDSFGGNRGSRMMCESRFEGWGPDHFAKELNMDTLRAIHGPWRLP